MAKQVADVQIHASEVEDVFLGDNSVSVDLIDQGLYLGNLACAHDCKTLEKLQITHILTIDVVPLPRTILDRANLIFEYVKMADIPKEDLISHLPQTNEFIKNAIRTGGTVLVHCYFGVSRSAAVVVGYIMEKYSLGYDDALILVKTQRRFASPNIGFAAQLKLFGHMGCKVNKDDPRYKQFRLKMAGQKLKQVKILPQLFADLVKPDPGLVRERPDPIVYRCKKCRRIVASQNNIIPHIPKHVKIELAKKGIRPPPSKLTGLHCAENGQILIEKLKSLACQIIDSTVKTAELSTSSNEQEEPGQSHSQQSDSELQDSDEGASQVAEACSSVVLVDEHIVCLGSGGAVDACRAMWFVEPMRWMKGVAHQPSGKLYCPKCANKIGSFSWVMGCKCPCGQKVAPAFYLVPSKVEWSNIVQNVQVTL